MKCKNISGLGSDVKSFSQQKRKVAKIPQKRIKETAGRLRMVKNCFAKLLDVITHKSQDVECQFTNISHARSPSRMKIEQRKLKFVIIDFFSTIFQIPTSPIYFCNIKLSVARIASLSFRFQQGEDGGDWSGLRVFCGPIKNSYSQLLSSMREIGAYTIPHNVVREILAWRGEGIVKALEINIDAIDDNRAKLWVRFLHFFELHST